ncbi:hypothetical protein MMC07_003641 [Pseudocyphellaria aurata]|nr:hypothetical protein [Pseudocyphellaria aurata]
MVMLAGLGIKKNQNTTIRLAIRRDPNGGQFCGHHFSKLAKVEDVSYKLHWQQSQYQRHLCLWDLIRLAQFAIRLLAHMRSVRDGTGISEASAATPSEAAGARAKSLAI